MPIFLLAPLLRECISDAIEIARQRSWPALAARAGILVGRPGGNPRGLVSRSKRTRSLRGGAQWCVHGIHLD